MDKRFKYVYAVEAGDSLYAATTDNHEACPGDLVYLDNGIHGIVKHVVFFDTKADNYTLLTDFVPVDEIVEVYHHAWSKPEESEEK